MKHYKLGCHFSLLFCLFGCDQNDEPSTVERSISGIVLVDSEGNNRAIVKVYDEWSECGPYRNNGSQLFDFHGFSYIHAASIERCTIVPSQLNDRSLLQSFRPVFLSMDLPSISEQGGVKYGPGCTSMKDRETTLLRGQLRLLHRPQLRRN